MHSKLLKKLLIVSKYTLIGLFVQCIIFTALLAFDSDAQSRSINDTELSVELKGKNIKQLFDKIEIETGFQFAYRKRSINGDFRFQESVEFTNLGEVLKYVASHTNLEFKRIDGTIHVNRRAGSSNSVFVEEEFLQIRTITGNVKSNEDDTGLPGVNVIIKGTSTGTVTDLQGDYSIDVPEEGATLVFSSVGFISEEVAVGNQSVIDLKLIPDIQSLSEIVVIGYGEQSRSSVTAAVSSVNKEIIENRPTANIQDILQGTASGVSVVTGSGQPGSAATIRIRGLGSFNAGNDPLYVIDGVPIFSGESNAANNASGISNLADLNPNDIESIDILKDAASAAIYGSRAANGVILIKTKSGREGKAQVDVNFFTGMQRVGRTIPVISARDARVKFNELWVYGWQNGYPWEVDANGNPLSTTNRYRPEAIDTLNPGMGLDAHADWQNEVFRTAPITQADISVRGGSEKLKYSLSGAYFDQKGIILNSRYTRFTSRINADYQAVKWLKIGTNFAYTRGVADRTRENTGNQSGWYYWFNSPSYTQTLDPVTGLPAQRFPTNVLENQQLKGYTNRVFANVYAEIKFTEELKLRSNLGVDVVDVYETEFYPSTVYGPGGSSAPRWSGAYSSFDMRWINENFLSYSKTFGDAHNLNAMVGVSFQEDNNRNSRLIGTNGSSDKIPTANASSVFRDISSFETGNALISYFGRVNYDFKGKYLISASVRSDGSSKFGADNRYATFPSVSLGWVLSEESFLAGSEWINILKLRTSWGKTGNQTGLGDFQALGLISTGYNYESAGVAPTASGIPNNALTWEESDQIDVGIDFTFLDGRIGIIADWYNKTTEGLLLDIPLPYSSGFSGITSNIGKIRNSGVDLELKAEILTGEFTWSFGGNISYLENEVLELRGEEDIIGTGLNRIEVGKPIGNLYAYEYGGVFSTSEDVSAGEGPNGKLTYANNLEFQQGFPNIIDQNGDGTITPDDQIILGNGLADYTGGITNRFTYKGFELNTLFTFSLGNNIYFVDRAAADSHDGLYRSPTPEAFDNRWRKPGDVTNWPRIVRARQLYNGIYRNSNQFIEDGSFIRMRNVTLAYNFNKDILDKIGLRRLRVYATGENIRTFTEYYGYDPEIVGTGVFNLGRQTRKLPPPVTLIFGINIGL